MKQLMHILCRERPVGTDGNATVTDYFEEQFNMMKFDLQSLPFTCTVWDSAASQMNIEDKSFIITPSPFSEGFTGVGRLVLANTLPDLKQADCAGAILLLCGNLTQSPLQPKDYPFYFPDEHRELISVLEQKSPKAIVALTGRHPLCGLEPFPLFEDGNFKIPSAYLGLSFLESIKESDGAHVKLSIISSKTLRNSRQLVATKIGKQKSRKIVLCAHMDSKYHTPGALDNAAGAAVLMEAAKRLLPANYSIDIVPFNGEEYFGASGELAYLQHLKEKGDTVDLLINIDSPCHIGALNSVSFYNFGEQDKELAVKLFEQHPVITEGEPWYAGDHCAFAFTGTPCIAVTSADLFEGGLLNTHTLNDTLDCVDMNLIEPTAEYIAALVHAFDKR